MDITIYLPDELGERAKKHNVNLSRLLRDALIAQFEQEDTVEKTLQREKEFTLRLEDQDGRTYKGRITGVEIAENVYLTTDESVVVYEPDTLRFSVAEDPETDLEGMLPQDQYIKAMNALGIEPTVDLDI